MWTQRYSATCTEKAGRAKATLLQIRDAELFVRGRKKMVLEFVLFLFAQRRMQTELEDWVSSAGRGNQSLASSDDMGKEQTHTWVRCETPRVADKFFPTLCAASGHLRSSCFRLKPLSTSTTSSLQPWYPRRPTQWRTALPRAQRCTGSPSPNAHTPVRNYARLLFSDLLRVRSVLSGCCVKWLVS